MNPNRTLPSARAPRRALERVTAASLFLVPLLMNPWGRSLCARIKEAGLWAGAALMGWWLLAVWMDRPETASVARRFAWPAGAWLAATLASTAFGMSPLTGAWAVIGLVPLMALGVSIMTVSRRASGRRRVMTAWAGSAGVCSAYALLSHYHIDVFHWGIVDPAQRAVGTIGGPIYFAAFLAMALPFGVALFQSRRSPKWLAPAIAVTVTALVASYSRAGGLAAALGVAATAYAGRGAWNKLALRRAGTALAAGAALAAVVFFADLHRAGDMVRSRVGGVADKGSLSVTSRQAHAKAALALTTKRPWLGWGPDAYRQAAMTVSRDTVGVEEALLMPHASPHSEWYTAMVEGGLVGLAAWGIFLLALASAASDRARNERGPRKATRAAKQAAGATARLRSVQSAAVLGGVTAFCVQGTLTPRALTTAMGLAVCWGLGAGLEATATRRNRAITPKQRAVVAWQRPVLALAALMFAVRIVAADVIVGPVGEHNRDQMRAALPRYRAAAHWNPMETGYRRTWCDVALRLAASSTGAEQRAAAASALEAAGGNLRLEPRNPLWNAGNAEALSYFDAPQAVQLAEGVVRRCPTSGKAWMALAVANRAVGNEGQEMAALRASIGEGVSEPMPYVRLAGIFMDHRQADLAGRVMGWANQSFPGWPEVTAWHGPVSPPDGPSAQANTPKQGPAQG